MKRKWHHPEAEAVATTGDRVYWRSNDELEDTPEFRGWLEREFPRGAGEVLGEEADETSRRGFMKYMGASTALAGLGMAGCRRPELYLVPFNEHVEWAIPGKALYYATAMPQANGCVPLVVTTFEGRPTKVDGNRLHPECSGGSDALTQASVLDLYDPDRSKKYLHKGSSVTAEALEDGFLTGFRAGDGEKAALLLGSSTSPTRDRLVAKLQEKYPKLQIFEYEALQSVAKRKAEDLLWGSGISAVPRFDRAEKILTLDCDFLGVDQEGADPASQWKKGRDPEEDMSRLYTVEPSFTLTGGVADHRFRTPASQVLKVAALLGERIGELTGDAVLKSAAARLVAKFEPAIFNQEWIEEAAADVAASKGKGLIVVGPRQPVAVHLLAGLMNKALGNVAAGGPIELFNHGRSAQPGIVELAEAIKAGQVGTLISLTAADPIYDAPADLNFAELLAQLEYSVHWGTRVSQTARACDWHVPGAHYLESWGDARSATGTLSVIQPMILPLYGGVSELDLLVSLLEAPVAEAEASPAMVAVRETFDGLASGDIDKAWNLTLRDGFHAVQYEGAGAVGGADLASELGSAEVLDHPHPDAYEVNLVPSAQLWDGRFVNNSWLQEVPDPMTKLTWDNAAVVSIATAEKLKEAGKIEINRDGEQITLNVDGRELVVPIFRMPGQADYTIQLALGYGQEDAGRVGSDTGFNAYPLRSSAQPYILTGAKLGEAKGHYELAPTAIHWSMDGRAIVREGTKERYDDPKTRDFAKKEGMDAHIPPDNSLYKGPDYFKSNDEQPTGPLQGGFKVDENHQWAMSIDLNTCIGCNACTIACQAENNIPVVGKDQVISGREMHWIRMDRYFSSSAEYGTIGGQRTFIPEGRGRPVMNDDEIEMMMQPVACVQCEAAPCETVCPVNATVHTDDGLNAMTYNRCIGTRYCANNCPYKARRFNYFDYNKRKIEDFYLGPLAGADGLGTTSLKLQKNPNVTVRMRGVIEKCTYCVQRIVDAKAEAKAEARDSRDIKVKQGRVTTACQDACPTSAVTFGNWADPEDPITEIKGNPRDGSKDDNPRNYDLLKYIGTRPRTSYLAKVRNPNPKMPRSRHVGKATEHMH
ncbi:MAG: MoCo/4Fe-4S cofactor protein with predicted Tat translocation signal [Verrucomicrobiales bacterium]|jgi:MoCo/4Fe-4S cofactor protein with predicted Tat translocation signal